MDRTATMNSDAINQDTYTSRRRTDDLPRASGGGDGGGRGGRGRGGGGGGAPSTRKQQQSRPQKETTGAARPYSTQVKAFNNISEHAESFNDEEYTRLRYTAVKCASAGTFVEEGYHMRCVEELGRKPRVMVVLTMYNESPSFLRSTLRKVGNNIQQMQQDEQRLGGFDKDVWSNVCVVIVSDGRLKANKETLEWLESIGMYSYDAVASGGLDTTMHLFERTVLLDKTDKSDGLEAANGWDTRVLLPPMQLVFALKEKNGGKLDSHYWFFEAFCRDVAPSYTIMLDVGTMPTRKAFSLLLAEMALNKHVGGVCGEIAVVDPFKYAFTNWYVATQVFEYKISNLLDKSLESVFGAISVLPGAFSAYRYTAIVGGPLRAYFRPLIGGGDHNMGPFLSNMYLAEDRILCFELFVSKGHRWTLKYLKGALARTDVPDSLLGLISQRRRWINGAFFAALYSLSNGWKVFAYTRHTPLRKLMYIPFWLYQLIVFVMAWFQIGTFFLTTYFLLVVNMKENNFVVEGKDALGNLAPELNTGIDFSDVPAWTYDLFVAVFIYVLVFQIILGLGSKPKHVSSAYNAIAMYLCIVMLLTIGAIALVIYYTKELTDLLVVSISLAFSATIVGSLLHGEIRLILGTFLQYLITLPVSVNILTVYSLCNLHDLSWGTKGLDGLPGVNMKAQKSKAKRDLDMGRIQTGDWSGALDLEDRKPKRAGTLIRFMGVDDELREHEETLKQMGKKADAREREYHNFRSNMLVFFLLCQTVYVLAITMLVPGEDFLLAMAFYLCGINGVKLFFSCVFLAQTYFNWIRLQCFVRYGIRLFVADRQMTRHKDFINTKMSKMIDARDDPIYEDQNNRDVSTALPNINEMNSDRGLARHTPSSGRRSQHIKVPRYDQQPRFNDMSSAEYADSLI